MSNPQNLPHLPVPTLSESVQQYINSVKPFLNPIDLERTKKVFNEFQSEKGVGPKLQKLLEERAKNTENWIQDWLLSVGYLGCRLPVIVYRNPGLVCPFETFSNEEEKIKFAAKLIRAILKYKTLVESGKVPIDMMGKDPLDMSQFEHLFGGCRIPKPIEDYFELNPQSHHIVIVRNNNFFKLQVLDDSENIATFESLIKNLQQIRKESETPGLQIGVLTAEHRDVWVEKYRTFTKDLTNLKSVREIQTSLFALYLDKTLPRGSKSDLTLASEQLVHGGGSLGNSSNRWNDKTLQFVVGDDGLVGAMYEHTPCDGQTIATMMDYILDLMKNDTTADNPNVRICASPKKLNFNINTEISQLIKGANDHVDKLAQDWEIVAFQFKKFGKEFIKSHNMSPDSLIQVALQLAFYKIHKTPGPQYEATMTRKFLYGRTGVIRSCLNEVVAFARTMLDSKKSNQEKVAALREAVKIHKQYANDSVNGIDADRHFLGLKMIALENKLPIPEIFKDPSFVEINPLKMKTSQVASKYDGFMCFGPLLQNGYSCCYNLRQDNINFAVSAFKEFPENCPSKFKQAIVESLEEIYNILTKL